MEKTDLDIIKYRLSLKQHSERQRLERKWAALRRLLAGSLDEYGLMGSQERFQMQGDDKYPANAVMEPSPKENIELFDIKEGKMNMIQRVLKSLVQQISLQLPTFEFDGLSANLTLLHRLYFEQTWGPVPLGADAVNIYTQCVWDMLTCGIGFPGNAMVDGAPVPHRYDPVKVLWDESGSKIEDMQWCVIYESRRASDWAKLYGKKHFEQYLENDRTVDVAFYYDTHGESGTSAAFLLEGGVPVNPDTPLDYTQSPFWIDIPITETVKKRVTFLPCHPLTYLMPSGHASPIGLVEILAGPQAFLLRAYALMQRQLSIPPTRLVNMDGLSEVTKKQLSEGIMPDVWQCVTGLELGQVMQMVAAPSLDPNTLTAIDRIERFFIESSDENPYSSGTTQDTKFAAEVNQIASQSGRGTAYLAKKVAQSMETIAQRHLWLAIEFDDSPRILQFKDIRLPFDESNPIGQYLDPHARPIVREDTMRYASPEEKINRARAMAKDLAPYGLGNVALEDLLRAYGRDDVQSALAQAAMQPQDPSMMAPGATPTAPAA